MRPAGQYGSSINAAAVLGGVNGRTFTIQPVNPAGGFFVSAYCVLVTTATVGNRVITIRIKDPAGNIIFSLPASTVAASSTENIVFAAFATNGTSGNFAFVPTPVGMPIPQNAQIQLLDINNVDPNDTLSANIAYQF